MVSSQEGIKNESSQPPPRAVEPTAPRRDNIVSLLASTGLSSEHGQRPSSETRRLPFQKSQQPQQQQQYERVPSSPHEAADLLGAFLDHRDLSAVGNFIRRGTIVGLLLWLFNTTAAYLLAPAESFELLEGMELDANIVVFLILIVTNASRFGPLLMERDEVPIKESGILFGCLAVQGMTLISISLMILFPTPVLIEPVTGNRVHLVRWAEWTSLSFMMTFLTEAIDIPLQEAEEHEAATQNGEGSEHWVGSSVIRTSWWHAIAISLSTAAGPIYAFAPDVNSWIVNYVVSMMLFSTIYVRLFLRWQRLLKAKKGSTVDSIEAYDRCRLSFRLMLCCCLSWTGLGMGLSFGWSIPFLFPEDSFWRKEGIFMAIESFFEGSSKVWYLMVLLHINEAVFDEPMRAVRRLEALRTMMSAVWDSSSDVMVLCLPHSTKSGHVKAIVSPAFSALEETCYPESSINYGKERSGRVAFLLEVDINDNQGEETTPVHRAFALDLQKPITRHDVRQIQKSLEEQVSNQRGARSLSIRSKNLDCIAKLIAKSALTSSADSQGSLVMHDMYGRSPDGRIQKVRFEGKVTKLETQAVLVVLRDISERFQRFEAEKRLIQEITERRKDAEANRFTRHEVKNGLLAAIAMVESLRDEIHVEQKETRQPVSRKDASSSSTSCDEEKDPTSELSSSCNELYLTLNEILDTILDEAMSRDVIHERYQLNQQRINVSQVLAAMQQRSTAVATRFTIVFDPNPFPELIVDPQLLRYIHRNAISNACRYGKPGGNVTTKLFLEEGWLQVEVINLPGDKHEKLVELGERGATRVFLPGTRLHRELNAVVGDASTNTSVTSAGDGAWIMKKCAKSLGGECSIRFESNQTVFRLRCPVVAAGNSHKRRNSLGKTFALPEGTFGIVIDDSGVQRKLMDRFLDMIGISKQKRVVLGKDAGEILGFSAFLEKIIIDNPKSGFLVIVDENLDIVDGVRHQTVSGSQVIAQVRRSLGRTDERRMLALVRSANDSAEDVSLYKSRAHGFICKAPLKKEGVMQMIEPLWKERFPTQPNTPTAEMSSEGSFSEEEILYTPSAEDLIKTIEAIDALCLVMRSTEAIDALCLGRNKEGTLSDLRPAVREELHKLKGDLMSLSSSSRMDSIMVLFETLRRKNSPDELYERWKMIRNEIMAVL